MRRRAVLRVGVGGGRVRDAARCVCVFSGRGGGEIAAPFPRHEPAEARTQQQEGGTKQADASSRDRKQLFPTRLLPRSKPHRRRRQTSDPHVSTHTWAATRVGSKVGSTG